MCLCYVRNAKVWTAGEMYAATLYQVSGTAREDLASIIMSTTLATPETTSGSPYVLFSAPR